MVADFKEFLDAYSCFPEDLHDCPCPERFLFLEAEVAPFARRGVCGPYLADGGAVPGDDAGQRLAR
jgi:hypothetical protein